MGSKKKRGRQRSQSSGNRSGGDKPHSRQKRDSRQYHQIGNHHIVPRSRGGPDAYWNSFSWGDAAERQVKHPAWHSMFVNQLPSEALNSISGWTTKNGKLDRSKMSKGQRASWNVFFGRDTLPEQAKVWIRVNFSPAEKKWEA